MTTTTMTQAEELFEKMNKVHGEITAGYNVLRSAPAAAKPAFQKILEDLEAQFDRLYHDWRAARQAETAA